MSNCICQIKIGDLCLPIHDKEARELIANIIANTYTKEEIAEIISQVQAGEVNLLNYYTKEQVNNLLESMNIEIDLGDYYTSAEVDKLLEGIENKSVILPFFDLDNDGTFSFDFEEEDPDTLIAQTLKAPANSYVAIIKNGIKNFIPFYKEDVENEKLFYRNADWTVRIDYRYLDGEYMITYTNVTANNTTGTLFIGEYEEEKLMIYDVAHALYEKSPVVSAMMGDYYHYFFKMNKYDDSAEFWWLHPEDKKLFPVVVDDFEELDSFKYTVNGSDTFMTKEEVESYVDKSLKTQVIQNTDVLMSPDNLEEIRELCDKIANSDFTVFAVSVYQSCDLGSSGSGAGLMIKGMTSHMIASDNYNITVSMYQTSNKSLQFMIATQDNYYEIYYNYANNSLSIPDEVDEFYVEKVIGIH